MEQWYTQAREKLAKEEKEGKYDERGKIILPAIKEMLLDFATQEAEFAQAIIQGGSLSDCISAVLKGVGNSMSGLETYKRAASFYFPGADVRVTVEIDLAPAAAQSDNKPDKPKGLLLDLSAFL